MEAGPVVRVHARTQGPPSPLPVPPPPVLRPVGSSALSRGGRAGGVPCLEGRVPVTEVDVRQTHVTHWLARDQEIGPVGVGAE